MKERDDKRGGSGAGCFIMGVLVFMALPLYMLSIGPMVWITSRYPGLQFLGVVYIPIGFIADHCEPVARALVWYMDLWR